MAYFNLKDIYKKMYRFYEKGDIFRTYIESEDPFPLCISLQRLKESDIQKNYTQVLKSIKELEKSRLPLVYKELVFKSLGRQSLPVQIKFTTLKEYLVHSEKEEEYKRFVTAYGKVIQKYPALKGLLLKKPFMLIRYESVWDELLATLEYFLANPGPSIYLRELCINNVDTKFVEKYAKTIDTLLSALKGEEVLNSLANYAFEKKYGFLYEEPLVRFRILDPSLYIQGLSDISLPKSDFAKLKIECSKVFIVENKITTLSFPDIKDAIVIFGKGYGVSTLQKIPWLEKMQIYYWGDMDMDGYAILSGLRSHYPKVSSFLMDTKTYDQFIGLGVYYAKREKPRILLNLTEDEAKVYENLCKKSTELGFRIEQERIPFDYLKTSIPAVCV